MKNFYNSDNNKTIYNLIIIQVLVLLIILLSYFIIKMYMYSKNTPISKETLYTKEAFGIDITETNNNKKEIEESEVWIAYLSNRDTTTVYNNENGIVSEEEIAQIETIQDINEQPVNTQNNVTTNFKNQTTTPIKFDTAIYTAKDGVRYSAVALLNIPSLGINYKVLSTTSDELLKISLNKFWGPNPNDIGNFVIIGHNYKDKTHFGKLPQIQNGALVHLTDVSGRTITYKVYDTFTINPKDVTCTSQLTNGKREVTLITCNNGGKTRFVAKAREI